jgi:indoleamine 2,3-dioxygenase
MVWDIRPITGFLIESKPLSNVGEIDNPFPSQAAEALEALAARLPALIQAGTLLSALTDLPPVALDDDQLAEIDARVLERLFALYGYLASAVIHGAGQSLLPLALALPLTQIAAALDRPPMLGYAGQVLHNWRLIEPAGGFSPENIELLLTFTDLPDESWFFKVHIAIEAQAGELLDAMREVFAAIARADDFAVQDCLRRMHHGLVQITRTFHLMPEGCDPDIYYQQVRPFLMSFDASVIFEGVSPNPTPLRGGSGAQSSVVPAALACLGIAHAANELTASLMDMRPYMPREHRAFIAEMGQSTLRDYCAVRAPLRDAYNHVLRQLITFRRAHLYYARTYIFAKSINPVGTGGTSYMTFLSKLIDETGEQFLFSES